MTYFINLVLFLIIYSFLGWCCETVYCSLGEGHFINRGFLNGPFCPVYGFGALSILLCLEPFSHSVFLIFILGAMLTSTLEYFTSFLLDKTFHAKWWDYSKRRFNLNGRICLLNSTLFGLLCVYVTFDLHPLIQRLINLFSIDFKLGFLTAFALYFIVDLILTIHSVLGIKYRMETLWQIRKKIMTHYDTLNETLLIELHEKFNTKLHESNILEGRLLKAFPSLSTLKHNELLKQIKAFHLSKK